MKDKKQEILNTLKRENLSTGRIAFVVGINFYNAEKYLNELLKEHKVIRKEIARGTYWGLP